MDDLISRQAAIDAVDGVDWYHQNKNGEMVHGANDAEHQAWYKADDIYAAIERVPSAQRWIPSYAGENVPEVGEAVLVTFKNSDGEADVFIARWGGSFYDCGYYCLSVSEVQAFMPLPSPWEGGEE